MSVRVGIIGVGVMGSDHARILATQVPGARVQAIYDADAARANSIADEVDAGKTMSDALALVRDASVDAVLVASPDQTHKDLTLAAIAAGKPVLCEKPLAPTPAECLEVLAAEAKRGRRLVQIGYMRRFDPAYVEMKAGLASGRLGSALMFHCIHRNVAAPDWFDSRMAVSNSAVHEFDIARWMLDTELGTIQVFRPKRVQAGAKGGGSPSAPVYLVLESASGQLVTIEVFNDATYGYDVRGELVCEKGTVALRAPLRTETNVDLVQGTTYPADWRPRFADAYRLQGQAWINSIERGTAVGASAWDGYAASAVAEAGLLSLAEDRRAEIRLAEQPSLYR